MRNLCKTPVTFEFSNLKCQELFGLDLSMNKHTCNDDERMALNSIVELPQFAWFGSEADVFRPETENTAWKLN